MEYVLKKWLAMFHSYVALGIKERFEDVACDKFCQLQFNWQIYM